MTGLKIAYVAAGAAGMYCGNCLHDNTLARAILELGHEILLIPTYTPIKTDEEDVSLHRVFFGGINVYLQQHLSLFRHTPWFLDRLLDSPALIDKLASRNMSVRPEDLGDMTVSMLEGDAGKQQKELEKLIHWLATEVRPDLVHLSNALFVGMARQMRERLGVPVLCNVAGEDMFLDGLQEPYQSKAQQVLRERAADVTRFVSANQYYADVMAGRMAVPREKIAVVSHGLDLKGHSPRPSAEMAPTAPFTIGYLARLAPEKGLHVLVEVFKLLAADKDLPPLKLRAAGYISRQNGPYLEKIQEHVREAGLADRFEYVGEVDRSQKISFLHSLDCMVMPTVYPESKGLPVLEAWANSVPVVVPDHGMFPELLADAGGGLLCQADNLASMAAALKQLIQNRALAAELGAKGRRAVEERYTARHMAERTLSLYREELGKGRN